MRKFVFSISVMVCLTIMQACHKDLWRELQEQQTRIERLEDKCDKMNTNILSLQTLVMATNSGDYITNVSPVQAGGKVIGYTITFKNLPPITIYHGENGKNGVDGSNGKDGLSPKIGVRQDSDGIWYWTVDGEWLYVNGEKIRATASNGANGQDGKDGKDGLDGITPMFKISNGDWHVSYDNGNTWTNLGKAVGDSGLNGVDGDSFFKGVEILDGYVVFTLNDDESTQIKIPFITEGELVLQSKYAGHVKTILTDSQKRTIVRLKIIGNLSESDVRYVADQMLALEVLDLRETDLIEIPSKCFCRGELKVGKESLREVYLPDSCVTIGNYAFYGCINLSVLYAPFARNMGSSTFQYMDNLKEVTTYTGVGFNNCHVSKFIVTGDPANVSLTNDVRIDSLVIAPNITSCSITGNNIGCLYFERPQSIVSDIYIHSDIEELILPSSLTSLAPRSFSGYIVNKIIILKDSKLSSFKFDTSVLSSSTYYGPFSGIKGDEKEVYCYLSTPPASGTYLTSSSGSMGDKITLYVPRKSLQAYEAKGYKTVTILPLEDTEYYKKHPEYQ